MPEQHSIDQGGEIKMPSELRLRQRLGMLSAGKAYKKTLTRELSPLAGDHLEASTFLLTVSAAVLRAANQAQQPQIEVHDQMTPKVINLLVKNEAAEQELMQVFDSPMYLPMLEDHLGKQVLANDAV